MSAAGHLSRSPTGPRLLVVGPAWIGDMVLAQSLFKTLRHRCPDATLEVLAPDWSRALVERMPEVDGLIPMPVGHGRLGLGERYRLGRRLQVRRYDQAIVLPNSLKSALVPFWAGISRRTGFLGELRRGLVNDIRRLDRIRLPMTVQRFVALGLERDAPLPPPVPEPALQVGPAQIAAALERHGLSRPARPLLGLCPGAEYGPAKRWPVEHFAEVARDRLRAGWAVWIFGSAKDAACGREIAERAGAGCVDLTGRTRLAEAVDLLSLTSAVVSNDSGLMHVAAALGRPLVAVYGSSDPGHTPPLSPKAEILSLNLSCSPCFQRQCPLGHLKCLKELPPARVLAAIAEMTA